MKRFLWRAVALCLIVGALMDCTVHALWLDPAPGIDMTDGQHLGQQSATPGSSAAQQACEDDCFCCYCSHVVTAGPVVVEAPVHVAILASESFSKSSLQVPTGLFRPPRA